jgi:hypothetical protein
VTLNDETLATFVPASFDSAIELAEQCRFYAASAAVERLREAGELTFESLDEALADLD